MDESHREEPEPAGKIAPVRNEQGEPLAPDDPRAEPLTEAAKKAIETPPTAGQPVESEVRDNADL